MNTPFNMHNPPVFTLTTKFSALSTDACWRWSLKGDLERHVDAQSYTSAIKEA